MITEEKAVELAWNFVRSEKIRVRGLRSVRRRQSPMYMPEWASRGEVWRIVFDLDIPPDRVMSPDIAAIIVDRETGEAAAVERL